MGKMEMAAGREQFLQGGEQNSLHCSKAVTWIEIKLKK